MIDKKVDFLVAGTQKGGTTALFSYLTENPQVFMPSEKELHFFDNDYAFSRNDIDELYSQYHANYDFDDCFMALGEATPIYMYWKHAVRRVYEYNPDMKWVFVLRGPVERAFSHWQMEAKRLMDSYSFSQAIRCEKERSFSEYPNQHRVYSYISRGKYFYQISRILEYFPMSQMLFLRSEDLLASPQETLNETFDFIGVNKLSNIQPRQEFVNIYDSMSEEDSIFLRQCFKNDVRKLEQLLGWSCDSWGI